MGSSGVTEAGGAQPLQMGEDRVADLSRIVDSTRK